MQSGSTHTAYPPFGHVVTGGLDAGRSVRAGNEAFRNLPLPKPLGKGLGGQGIAFGLDEAVFRNHLRLRAGGQV